MNKREISQNRFISIAIFLILVLCAFHIPTGLVNTVQGGKYGDIIPTTYELQLLNKINENRSASGAGPLTFNASLCWVARAHSQDMIDYDSFSHTSSEEGQFNGATFQERVKDYAEYENGYIGEIIAIKSWGIDVESTMASWKNSPPHWDIIIDPNLNEIGIGLLEGEWDGTPNAGLHTVDFGGASLFVDLTLDDVDIDFEPSSPYEGQEVNISAAIHNQGSTDSYFVSVKFYDGDPDSGGLQIGQEQVIQHILMHGESKVVNIIWNTTGYAGSHDIYVVVDPEDIISETNEGNNKASRILLVNGTNSTFHLDNGWNLVSFPQVISNASLENVLSSLIGDYDAVQTYNSSDSNDYWKHYHVAKPNYMNDLHELENNLGFWIHINNLNGADFLVNGTMPSSPQSILLSRGWNLVGYPSFMKRSRDDALNNLTFGMQIDQIQHYDSIDGEIKDLDELGYFEPGNGYWIHAVQSCEWSVN